MTENEKIAALAAALDGMKAERNWYRTAWAEAFRERDALRVQLESLKRTEARALAEALAGLDAAETELEHATNTASVLREGRDELSELLTRERGRVASLEYSRNKAQRELSELREWAAAAQEDLRTVRRERDELRDWYEVVMEEAEEFGVGG